MNEIIVLDTSVLLNLLDVPGKAQRRGEIVAEFQRLLRASGSVHLLVPLAAVVETGNHIGQLDNGVIRRQRASAMVEMIRQALANRAPFGLADLDDGPGQLTQALDAFVEWACTGSGWGDLTIQQSWHRLCNLHPRARVRIWSLDHHLAAFDREP